jgi:sulfur-oxidizing protein SoxX
MLTLTINLLLVSGPQKPEQEENMVKSQWVSKLAQALLVTTIMATASVATAAEEKKLSTVEEGKKLAFTNSKGNCIACHMIAGGAEPGEIGPPLMAMQARYPDRQKLFDKLWGKPGVELMPESQMLPFGKHKVLTDDEINKIVDFMYTL